MTKQLLLLDITHNILIEDRLLTLKLVHFLKKLNFLSKNLQTEVIMV